MSTGSREPVVAARGTQLRCRGWRQEGLLRMLENVLEVGERPEDLVVYASLAQAARDWPSFDRIVAALRTVRDDQTLVVQSGKPIGLFASSPLAPVVVMATGNVVGHYATAENFYALAEQGLTMWGGLTAGDWQYIGSQGVLQGVYEVLTAVAREHFGGSLAGRLVLTSGLGGMGSAQPVAIRMAGAVGLVVEADPAKLERSAGRGDVQLVANLDDAIAACRVGQERRRTLTVGLPGNAATVFSELAARGVTPDIVTDLTAAHDALVGYLPEGISVADWPELRRADPVEVMAMARRSMAVEVRAMLAFRSGVRSSSRTATTSGSRRSRQGSLRRSRSTASRSATSGPSSAAASGPSAGWR